MKTQELGLLRLRLCHCGLRLVALAGVMVAAGLGGRLLLHTGLVNSANVKASKVVFGHDDEGLPSAVRSYRNAGKWHVVSDRESSSMLHFALMRAERSCGFLSQDDFEDRRAWRLLQGRCEWLESRRDRAVAEWRAAGGATILMQLAHFDKMRGELQSALEGYTAALAVLPGSVRAWTELGDLHERAARWLEAERAYDEALRVIPESALAHQAMAGFRWRRGWLDKRTEQELERALELVKQGLEVDPAISVPWLYTQLAQIYLHTARPQQGEEAARSAIRLEPKLAYAHHFLGEALRMQGSNREAIAELTTALRLGSDNLWVQYSLAVTHLQAGDLPRARVVTSQLRELAPDFSGLPNLEAAIRKASAER